MSRALPNGLGAVRVDLRCKVLGLRVDSLLSSGAEIGLKISNNSTTEKSNLKKHE